MVPLNMTTEAGAALPVLGPFYAEGAPLLPVDGDLIGSNAGTPLLVCGHVLNGAGKPVASALLEFWQAADNGKYWQQDPAQHPHNLRFRMTTGDDGVPGLGQRRSQLAPGLVLGMIDRGAGRTGRAAGGHARRRHLVAHALQLHDYGRDA